MHEPPHPAAPAPTPTGPSGRGFQMRSLIITAFLPTLLFGIGQGAVIPVMPLYAKGLGASVAMIGLIVAMRGVGTMVMDIPAGMLVSRFGERWSLVGGTIVLMLVAGVTAISGAPWQFAIVSFTMGGAWAVFLLARLSYVTEHAPIEFRGRALSTIGGLGRVGNLIGPLIGGYIASIFGLQSTFYLQALLSGSAALVLFLVVDDEKREPMAHGSSPHQLVFGVLRDHRAIFATGGVAAVMLQVLRNGRQIVIPLWGDAIGLDFATIGWVYSASNLIDSLMFYPAGYAMDRWGRRFVVLSSLVVLSVGMAIIPLATNALTLALVGLVSGLGNGLGAGIVQTLGADFSPSTGRGEFLGVWRLLSDLGASAGPAVFGVIAGAASLGVASVATGGIGFIGAFVIYLALPEPLQRDGTPRGRRRVP